MTRLAKFVVAVALFVGVSSPALAGHHHVPKCHPRSNYGQYNYRPSVYGFNGYGASKFINSTPGYSSFRAPTYGFGYNNYNSFNQGGNYGAVFANPQSFGFGPYNW